MKPTIIETRADGRQFGWLGTTCPNCNGTGEMNTQHSWAACSRCAGTGEDYGEIPVQGMWQPIDTAPKDGTYILLCGPSGYTTISYRVAVGYWRERFTQPGGYWADHAGDHFEDDGPDATHWMPLPPPPTI